MHSLKSASVLVLKFLILCCRVTKDHCGRLEAYHWVGQSFIIKHLLWTGDGIDEGWVMSQIFGKKLVRLA